MPKQTLSPTNIDGNVDGIRSLYGQGLWPVLLNPAKEPLWTGWNRRRASVSATIDHVAAGGLIGHIPYALTLSALDVDHIGNPADLFRLPPALVVVTSRTPGRQHRYYLDEQPRRPTGWAYLSLSGDVRSADGVIALYGDSAGHLDHALSNPPTAPCRFP